MPWVSYLCKSTFDVCSLSQFITVAKRNKWTLTDDASWPDHGTRHLAGFVICCSADICTDCKKAQWWLVASEGDDMQVNFFRAWCEERHCNVFQVISSFLTFSTFGLHQEKPTETDKTTEPCDSYRGYREELAQGGGGGGLGGGGGGEGIEGWG